MTPQHLTISFEPYAGDYPAGSTELIHRIRNLGEDIFRALRGRRLAELQNMDTATETLDLFIPSAGKVRSVQRIVQTCLQEHNFTDAIVRIREHSTG